MKERRHMIPEAIRGMEKPIERALASGACIESGRPLIELTPSGAAFTFSRFADVS